MPPTSLPFQELMGDSSPAVVTELVSGLINAAQAASTDTIHPLEVVIGRGARVNVVPRAGLAPHALTSAQELASSGPSPATMVYAVGMLGAMAALRDLSAPPREPRAYEQWLGNLARTLEQRWAEALGARAAIQLLVRCLAFDPGQRPSPQKVLAEARSAGLSSEEGLVTLTGYAAPAIEIGYTPVGISRGHVSRAPGPPTPPLLVRTVRFIDMTPAPAGSAARPARGGRLGTAGILALSTAVFLGIVVVGGAAVFLNRTPPAVPLPVVERVDEAVKAAAPEEVPALPEAPEVVERVAPTPTPASLEPPAASIEPPPAPTSKPKPEPRRVDPPKPVPDPEPAPPAPAPAPAPRPAAAPAPQTTDLRNPWN